MGLSNEVLHAGQKQMRPDGESKSRHVRKGDLAVCGSRLGRLC